MRENIATNQPCVKNEGVVDTRIAFHLAVGLSSGANTPNHLGRRCKIPQRQFQSTVLRVVVVIEAERDIQGIAGKQLRLLKPFRHMPSQRFESDRLPPTTMSAGL